MGNFRRPLLRRQKHNPEGIDLRPIIQKTMNAKLLGILRHLLTFGGGFLVAKGWLDAETLAATVGVIVTIAGNVMSVTAPEKKQ